jgi:RNA polymerase sigma-70 factor (ECF subfamily)
MSVTYATDDSRASGRPAVASETGRSGVLPTFRAVYDQYFDFVWTCARRMGVAMDAVDDIVQEIFIVVHARLHTIERPESLRSWLYGVVRRTVSTYHRGQHARAMRESRAPVREGGTSAMQPSPLDLAVMSDEVRLMWRLLGQIDDRKREVLILAELEEMAAPEIAEAVGIPLNTAYSRLRAARQDFNEAFLRYRATQKDEGTK